VNEGAHHALGGGGQSGANRALADHKSTCTPYPAVARLAAIAITDAERSDRAHFVCKGDGLWRSSFVALRISTSAETGRAVAVAQRGQVAAHEADHAAAP
jgi:hypothetical protein